MGMRRVVGLTAGVAILLLTSVVPAGAAVTRPAGGSAGCGGDAPATGWSTATVTAAGKERSYELFVPPGYDPDARHPVVFVWHGLGGNAKGMAREFPIEDYSDGDAVVVVPQGLVLLPPERPGWITAPGPDLTYFDVLVRTVRDDLCVDPLRLFSTGMSNGALMSNFLGCVRGDELRAIAPMSGGLPVLERLACDGEVGAMIVHGSADTLVPLPVGYNSYQAWRNVDDCHALSPRWRPTAIEECVDQRGCGADAPVLWCKHTGAHVIPPWAPQAVWQFFSSF